MRADGALLEPSIFKWEQVDGAEKTAKLGRFNVLNLIRKLQSFERRDFAPRTSLRAANGARTVSPRAPRRPANPGVQTIPFEDERL